MSLPGAGYPARRQALVLLGFLGFQSMDAVTTHLGLQVRHVELNWLMAPLISVHGELAAYAVKGLGVAALLGILMLLQYRKPRVWQAFLIASWISALGVVLNLSQLLSSYSTASM